MTMRLRKWLPAALAVAGFALVTTPREASAALILAAEIRNADDNSLLAAIIAYDDNVVAFPVPAGYTQVLDDTPGISGLLTLEDQDIGGSGLLVTGSTHTSLAGTTVGTNNTLTSGSSTVLNLSDVPIVATVIVGDTDYTPPAFTATTSGSGTFVNAEGSDIFLDWFDDPDNNQPGDPDGITSVFGNLVASFTFTAPDENESFSHNGAFVLDEPDLDPFAMTLRFSFDLPVGGQLTARGQALLKPVAVPEPGTLALALTALPVLGITVWRRRRKQS